MSLEARKQRERGTSWAEGSDGSDGELTESDQESCCLSSLEGEGERREYPYVQLCHPQPHSLASTYFLNQHSVSDCLEVDYSYEDSYVPFEIKSKHCGSSSLHLHTLLLTVDPYSFIEIGGSEEDVDVIHRINWKCDVCKGQGRRGQVYHCYECETDVCLACSAVPQYNVRDPNARRYVDQHLQELSRKTAVHLEQDDNLWDAEDKE